MSENRTETKASLSPRRLYALLALAETVTWTLLLGGMVLKYVTDTTDLGVSIAGPIHGFVFLAYCAATVLIAVDQRWRGGRIALGLLSGVPPYLTIPFERWAGRTGLLGPVWRLRGAPARGPAESVVSRAVRSPARSALVILLGVAVVFALLLALGPPGG